MIAITFVVGLCTGIACAGLYAAAVAKFFVFDSGALFQTFTILAFFGFIAPTARVSITLLLRGLERGDETAGILKDLRTNALPLIDDTKALVAEIKGMDMQRAVDFLDKVTKDGTVDRFAKSIDGVADKIHDLIKKIEAKAVDKMIGDL
jgi:hypothetical protein